MTKIFALADQPELPPSQEKIVEFLKHRPYEVFSIKEVKEMAASLGLNKNNASWCFWALEKRRLIAKKRVGRKVYYGSLDAIEQLNRELKKRGHR